jgi:hypothetical protein
MHIKNEKDKTVKQMLSGSRNQWGMRRKKGKGE